MLEKHHGLAHVCFLRYLCCDLSGLFFTDPFYFCQPLRLLLHNTQCVILEASDDPGCQSCTNSLDGTGTQVTFHSHGVLGHYGLIGGDGELSAIGRMLRIMSIGFDGFPFTQILETAHAGQLFLLSDHNHNRVPIVLIPEDNMVHISFYGFFHILPLLFYCHCSVPTQLQAKIHARSPLATAFLLGCGMLSYSQHNVCADLLNSSRFIYRLSCS